MDRSRLMLLLGFALGLFVPLLPCLATEPLPCREPCPVSGACYDMCQEGKGGVTWVLLCQDCCDQLGLGQTCYVECSMRVSPCDCE